MEGGFSKGDVCIINNKFLYCKNTYFLLNCTHIRFDELWFPRCQNNMIFVCKFKRNIFIKIDCCSFGSRCNYETTLSTEVFIWYILKIDELAIHYISYRVLTRLPSVGVVWGSNRVMNHYIVTCSMQKLYISGKVTSL